MGPRRLTLLRHGQAQPIDSCAEDFERALTKRGNVEAREMAKRMAHRNWIPDLILVSPAERAWVTAEIVARACELDEKHLLAARELYLASPETTWRVLTQYAGARPHIMICGHNPGLSQLAGRLGPRVQTRELPTAGLATASWHKADWSSVLPESAEQCDFDDPENMTDIWSD